MTHNTRNKGLAIVLLVVTAITIIFFPALKQYVSAKSLSTRNHDGVQVSTAQREQIEVVFVLDTTSSMAGLIQAAKEKIWSIASTMASAQPTPVIKMGLVGFRDRGDQYVTRVIDLSEDLDSMYARLMDFRAEGGGDGPESVNQALYEAVHRISWSQDTNSYKVIFLLGDAPPHMDYQDDVKYPQTLSLAQEKGIVVNAIQCGEHAETMQPWRQIAQLGRGRYFQVAQSGSAVAVTTPYDKTIASMAEELDATKLYYGSKEEKVKQVAKLKAAEKLNASSSASALARRGVFNASKGGAGNYLGEGELVDDVVTGRVDLSKLDKEKLPESLQVLPQAELEEVVVKNAQQRKRLQQEIQALADKRKAYVQSKLEQDGEQGNSLDDKIFSAIKSQALEKGLVYSAEALEY